MKYWLGGFRSESKAIRWCESLRRRFPQASFEVQKSAGKPEYWRWYVVTNWFIEDEHDRTRVMDLWGDIYLEREK